MVRAGVRAGGNGNPFRPGAGQMPPWLAGRDKELALAERRLDELAGGVPPAQGILFYGPRGNGKTVLLERIADRARALGMRAERLPADAVRERDVLVQELQERAGLTEDRLSGVQLGPIGATTQPGAPTRNVSRLFSAWVQAVSEPLVVLLDEAQTMDPGAGRAFFEAVQNAGSDALPYMVIAAGTPDAPRKIRRAGTFAERAFEKLPIGRLDPAATTAALTKPAEAAGRPMDDDARARLGRASQDYPYFVQLLGSAAWDMAVRDGEPTVTGKCAEEAVDTARVVIEGFYAERFDEAREREVEEVLAPLARLADTQGGRVDDRDLSKLLLLVAQRESVLLDRGSLLTTLRDLGIVWETSSAVWEMGIPSFADYILHRAGRSPGGVG